MAQPIEIIIRQGGQGGLPESVSVPATIDNTSSSKTIKSKKESKSGNALGYAFYDIAKTQLTTIINHSISNYGNMTGDYIGQQNINTYLGIGMDFVGIALAGVAGGAIGMLAATVGFSVKKGLSVYDEYIAINKQNTQASFMRERSGNSLNNGSAGTYE